jgi:hypothetical protein
VGLKDHLKAFRVSGDQLAEESDLFDVLKVFYLSNLKLISQHVKFLVG